MPRAGLTTARVVEEAERIADEDGLQQLTLSTVARRLGVRQPSLYKHIDGMEGLLRSIAVQAKNELADTISRATVGRAGGDAIRSMAHAYRAWALQHPGRYMAIQRAPADGDVEDDIASRALVQVVLDVLAGFELRGDDAIDATRTLRSALHGFVTLETVGGFGLPGTDRSFDRLIRALLRAFTSW